MTFFNNNHHCSTNRSLAVLAILSTGVVTTLLSGCGTTPWGKPSAYATPEVSSARMSAAVRTDRLAANQPVNARHDIAATHAILPADWKRYALAQNNLGAAETATDAPPEDSSEPGAADAQSPECAAFAADIDADVGDIIRAGCRPTTAQMARLMDNPLGNVAMLFTQFDYYRLKNPTFNKERDQGVYTGIAQFPKGLNKNWNLINRVVWTVPSVPIDDDEFNDFGSAGGPGSPFVPPPGSAPIEFFGGRTTGFGDMYYIGLFSPKKPVDAGEGKLVWGLGFDLAFPTASEDILGSGKWSAGPSALAAYLGPKWKLGGLLQHYWDYAGDSDRDDVNLSNLQYLYYYSLNPTTSVGAAPNIICDWEQDSGNKCTVPVGLGINKTVNIGKVPVRFGLEGFYSVVKPDDIVGAHWSVRFYAIPAAPSALFKWMQ
jgi:hypothetical protein